jgi:integrase
MLSTLTIAAGLLVLATTTRTYILAITPGMRQGELVGLTWDNIDLDKRQITVTRTLQKIEGKFQFGETKTAHSRRVVPLSNTAVASLRAHRDRQHFERQTKGAKWLDHNLVFPNTQGGPYHARNLVREFQKALAAAGMAPINFHSLRHTCASLLLTQGVHMRVVVELLGHSQVRMTMDLYSHVVPELKCDPAEGMDVFLDTEGGSEAV